MSFVKALIPKFKTTPQITLFLAAVFGLSAGAAPNFVTFAALIACMGFGTGGK
jgi:hypothetical protein